MNNKRTIISGSIWTTASTLTTAVVQILRLSILAHFLEKSDFGIVAILTMVLGFTNMFSEMGFSTIIMHKKDITEKEFNSLYWAQFFVYAIIYSIISLSSRYVAAFFNEPSITYLLPIAMIDIILYGVGRLYDTVMQKELKFNILAKRNIIASFISITVAIVLAYKGAGIYSLIISTLTQTIILNVWNLIQGMKSIPLRPYFSFSLIKPLFSMGLNQTGSHILDYVSTKIDVFIIGKMLGSEALGIYNLAKELILKGTMLLNSIVNKVCIPIFARKQDDKESLRRNYCKLTSLISFFNFPICTIIGVMGYVIIPVLYGKDYSDVIPILYILSVWGYLNCLGNTIANIVIATGRTDISFKYTIIRLLCYIPCIYIVSTYDIIVLAWGVTFLTALSTLLSWYMQAYKTIQLDIIQYGRSFIRPLILSIFIGSLGYITLNTLLKDGTSFIISTFYGIIWCIIYASAMIFSEKGTIKSLKSFIKH